MPSPLVRILGAYRVDLTQELFASAMVLKYGGLDLEGDRRQKAERSLREELSSIVLVEALVSNRDAKFNVGDFGQVDSEQAPYDEHFLSDDGSKVVAIGFDVPAAQSLRITFFLHCFDPAKPIKTSYGNIIIHAIQPMPARLQHLVPYEPVD